VLLPKEMLVRRKVKKDDTLFATETRKVICSSEVEWQLAKGREFMAKYRNTYGALAE